MAILVRVPVPILEDLVEAAISKQGNIYRAELAKLIGASKESLDGKTSLYLISLMKLCGFAEADMANVLRKSKIVNQRGAVTHDISAGDELKGVIDNALEGFQLLISESFKPIEHEKEDLINWARMYSLWPVNITTACCSAEFGAASGARHDLERFGVLPIGSLRQSDLIVIEGTITKKMAKRLRMIYDQMALPRYVIAMGDCAMSGGLFHDSYSIVNGAHEFVPVDVYVPGCPPRPEALEQAIIMLQEKIRRSKVYEQG